MKTKVKVHITNIKYFDSEADTVKETTHPARLTVVEARKYVRDIHEDNVLIQKETHADEFSVSSDALYQLKEVESND